MMPDTITLARSYVWWRWLAWGAGAGRTAARAQTRVAGVVLLAFAASPFLILSRGASRGWSAETLALASAGIVAAFALSVGLAVADGLSRNELFQDVEPRGALVPHLVGMSAGLVVSLPFFVALWTLNGASPVLAAVPGAAVTASLVRPQRSIGTSSERTARTIPWPATSLRAFAAGLFSAPRLLAALGMLVLGGTAAWAASGEGARTAAAALCVIASVLAGGLISDPARWLLSAWTHDGTRARTKAARPVAVWLGSTAACAAGLSLPSGAPFFLAAGSAIGLGAAFLGWRIAYAGEDGAAWRDGGAGAAVAVLAVSVAPPAVILVAVAAAGLVAWRAIRRVAPGV